MAARRLRLTGLLLVVAAIVPLSAGAGPRLRDEVEVLGRDVRELRQRLAESEREREALQRQITELRRELGVDEPGARSPADLAARLDSLDADVRVLFEKQNESNRELSVLLDKVDALFRHQTAFGMTAAQPGPGPGGLTYEGEALAEPEAELAAGTEAQAGLAPPATSPIGEAPYEPRRRTVEPAQPDDEISPLGGLVDPQELYGAARADYGRGAYELAADGFEEFLVRFPTSNLADNAAYWLGECAHARSDFEAARRAFERVLTDYPAGEKAPDASLKLGFSLLELNHTADGIIRLQQTKDTYPGTVAARLAKQKLESLGLM